MTRPFRRDYNSIRNPFGLDSFAHSRRGFNLGLLSPFSDPSGPVLDIRDIGPLEIRFGGVRLDPKNFRGPKALYLLTYLASSPGAFIADEIVMEAMWEAKSKSNLYAACSLLRRELSAYLQGEDLVIRRSGSLSLNPKVLVRSELHRLQGLERVFKDNHLTPEALYALCSKALGLYRGPYLSGCSLDWARFPRNYVERVLVEITTTTLNRYQNLGLEDKVGSLAIRLLDFEPCHPQANLALVRDLLKVGAKSRALQQIRLYVHRCKKVLGCSPDAELMFQFQELWGGPLNL